MQKSIKITLNRIGIPTIEAIGFQGNSCKSATMPYTDKLSGGGESYVEKPEMHETSGDESEYYHEQA